MVTSQKFMRYFLVILYFTLLRELGIKLTRVPSLPSLSWALVPLLSFSPSPGMPVLCGLSALWLSSNGLLLRSSPSFWLSFYLTCLKRLSFKSVGGKIFFSLAPCTQYSWFADECVVLHGIYCTLLCL